jgi:hypothetical protein
VHPNHAPPESLCHAPQAIALSCLLAFAGAKPAAEAEAEADAQWGYGFGGHVAGYAAAPVAPVAYHHAAPTCVTEDVILITQVCTPTAEEVCSTETVDTQEIEYEKVCTEIVDTLCDAPVHAPVGVAGYAGHGYGKREAEAEADADADAQYFAAPYAHHGAYAAAPVAVAPLPVAHAVAHSVTETVKHACREVTTEHCVDNPKVIEVPVEVEHCHTVTKVTCAPVENALPKTTCEAVVTTATQHAVAPAVVPAAYHAGYGYGK